MTLFTRLLFAAVLCALVTAPINAGKYNKKLNIGDAAPTWEKLEGTDGKKHALADWKDKDVLVVVFTCNSCIVAEGYEDRLIAFAAECNKADSKVGFVAINVNTGKADALPAMKERAAKKKFGFTYLYDPTQKTALAYGAMFTPECFVLNKDRKVVYMGAFDDKPDGDPKVKFVEDAVKVALAGKAAAPAETPAAAGCKIRFDKKDDDE
ncbi:redoxin domain-containing protein [Gemmata sp. G18]|uniref:Redoxin domain-containing protein n=1 Tax=Gemmata palustris TaxID=2822762 RepID=A0ABS5BZU3_9BACT|nr:redoxin domain-containing protein [Gemmata palustris]MBP3959251.1 redoxin domain-containing protein [Gemmata palustris]